MRQTRHILLWILSLLLSGMVLPLWANNAELEGLHCGDVVTITATPDVGYRFVRWSDGNTDNPREIEITQTVNLSAEYELICQSDPVPVVWLYGQLLLVDVDSLQRMGYTFSEKDATWYRIVGDMDVASGERDDQPVATGYYYAHQDQDVSLFYVAIDIGANPPVGRDLCSDTLYGQFIQSKKNSPILNQPSNELTLIPNFGPPGTCMDIGGLNAQTHYTIQVFDAVGRKLEEYNTFGVDRYTIVAQNVPGYYLVQITDSDNQTVLKYIVKQ